MIALSKIEMSIDLGGTRQLQVDENNEIFTKDVATKKCAFFTALHWKHFVGVIADIAEHVQISSVGKKTHYKQHIGGTCQNMPCTGIFQLIASFLLWTSTVGMRIRRWKSH